MSISIAVAFLITMQIVSEQKFLENFSNKNEDKENIMQRLKNKDIELYEKVIILV